MVLERKKWSKNNNTSFGPVLLKLKVLNWFQRKQDQFWTDFEKRRQFWTDLKKTGF